MAKKNTKKKVARRRTPKVTRIDSRTAAKAKAASKRRSGYVPYTNNRDLSAMYPEALMPHDDPKIHVFAVDFTRAIGAPWERGVMVGELIVDVNSKAVREPIGDWREVMDEGALFISAVTRRK